MTHTQLDPTGGKVSKLDQRVSFFHKYRVERLSFRLLVFICEPNVLNILACLCFAIANLLLRFLQVAFLPYLTLTDTLSLPVLDDFEPSVSITLSYPAKHKSVDLGNKLKPKAVQSQPVFNIHASKTAPTRTIKSSSTYVLVLTDPDATSRAQPVKAQMCRELLILLLISPQRVLQVGL